MERKIALLCISLVLTLALASLSYAQATQAQEKQTFGEKFKAFWNSIFGYSANVTEKSVNVVTDAGSKGGAVVGQEMRRVGEVTSGDVKKTKKLVTEPLEGTAQAVKSAIETTVQIPVAAAQKEK